MRGKAPLASLMAAAVALAGCGEGGGAAQPAQDAPAAWFDQAGIQAFGPARTVVLGFDGTSSYIRQDDRTHSRPGVFGPDLSYIRDSGAPAPGQAAQWLRFTLRGEAYFATQGQHLPIVLNFAQYPDPRSTRRSPAGVEGRMIFIGGDEPGAWDCPSRSSANIYFETRLSGRAEAPDVLAVKCARDAPGLRDGVAYRIEVSAGPRRIAYTIADEAGRVLAEGATDDGDYPPLSWNQPFLRQLTAADSDFPARLAALAHNREFAVLAAFTTRNAGPWSLTLSDIASGWK
ncbi:hypothetical protein [Ottowia sp.]|uniref:hypothetical protein n=1 Tax=Ottowia sp. TaxID=1898956 RepID=UPI0039E3B258